MVEVPPAAKAPGADFRDALGKFREALPAAALLPEAPPARRPFASAWDFVVRGHRPIGLWVGVLILFVHGVVLPIAELLGRRVVSFSAVELAIVGGLVGLGWHQRTCEKREGLTS